MKPLIGVFAHAPRTTDLWAGETCPETYLIALENAGADPILLPAYDNDEALRRYVALCDGFVLPGGIDINPLTYGEDPHPNCRPTSWSSMSASCTSSSSSWSRKSPCWASAEARRS